jgi:hypothetical protein
MGQNQHLLSLIIYAHIFGLSFIMHSYMFCLGWGQAWQSSAMPHAEVAVTAQNLL